MALTAPAQIDRKDVNILQYPMAVKKIYDGALVKINAAGYLDNCAAEAGAVFAGVALQTVDNSAGNAGDHKMRVYKSGIVKLAGSGFAITDQGLAVYATDENTITKTQAANIQRIGVIVAFESSTAVWVKLMCSELGLEAAIANVATTAATNSTPYGYAQAQADAIVSQLNLVLAVLRKHNMIQG